MEKSAAVSYIEREDGRILCCWNRRYGGWSMPGGLVEPGETPEQGQERELMEETSLITMKQELMFERSLESKHLGLDRASHIYVFRVTPTGIPRETEIGSPVTWLTREEFLKWSPFATIYQEIFSKHPAGQFTVPLGNLNPRYLAVSDAWTERQLIVEMIRNAANGYLKVGMVDRAETTHWTADAIENCDHRRIK